MKKDICVIDDDTIYQLIIGKVIDRTAEFDDVCYYNDALEAIEEFKDPNAVLPELILLDINMPQMDGWQFLDQLILLRPNFVNETVIYVVTSSIALSDREKALSYSQVAGFLSKPVSVEKLKKIAVKHRK